jgi:protein-tyrosine-phosphatase
MKILVVCRLNQARSIIISAFIRKHFPEAEVESAGVQAISGEAIPKLIEDIAETWNLTIVESYSRNIRHLQNEEPWDLVICSDNNVAHQVEVLGVQSRHMVYLAEYADHPALVVNDPVGMTFDATKIELSKALTLTSRVLSDFFLLGSLDVRTLYWNSNADIFLGDLIARSLKNEVQVVDTQLRYPELSLWKNYGVSTQRFSLSNYDSLVIDQLNIGVLICEETNVDEEIVYLSSAWRDLLTTKIKKPVIVIPNRVTPMSSTYFLSLMWSKEGTR